MDATSNAGSLAGDVCPNTALAILANPRTTSICIVRFLATHIPVTLPQVPRPPYCDLALDSWIGAEEQPDDITLVLARQV
jgi:hypothetical protein